MRARLVTIVIAGLFAAIVLWSAGVPPLGWLREESAPVGPATPAPTKIPSSPVATPEATAEPGRLHLVSTAPGRNWREGTAQIGTDVTNPQTYAAGASLANGATLEQIHTDYVVLRLGKVESALYVDGFAAEPGAVRSRKVVDSVLQVQNVDDAPKGPAPARTYTHLLRAAPHFENESVIGFDVYPGTQAGQFTQLGLQAGDLLMQVDGTPLAEVGALNSALQALSEGRSMTVTIRRGNQTLDIPLDGAPLLERAASAITPPMQ